MAAAIPPAVPHCVADAQSSDSPPWPCRPRQAWRGCSELRPQIGAAVRRRTYPLITERPTATSTHTTADASLAKTVTFSRPAAP